VDSRAKVGATATLSGNIVRVIVADAVARGLSEREIIERFDIPAEALRDVDARVPARVMVRLWEGMPRVLNDPSYGVHLGERTAETSMTLIGRMFGASPTVGDGVTRLVELQRLVNDVHRSEMVKDGDVVAFRMRTKDSPLPVPRHATEFVFAWMVSTVRRSTGADVWPVRARFEVSPPEDVAEHRRVLGCPVEFDAEYNELAFPAATLALPNRNADTELREILDSHARHLLEKMPAQKTFAMRVAEVLAPRLSSSPTIDDVAALMKMSARTLQRYLREEETTFADVLDDVRRRRAEVALRETEEPIASVSASLGFGDQSAFHKAFVRWTGKTPGAFRKG
jgi:AraC-like DNA-binding protein